MKWFIAKITYRIVCGDGNHTPQFDEQLRLIEADNNSQAFQKARKLGQHEQDNFMNANNKPVHWKFLDVSELIEMNNFSDGFEISSHITEEPNAEAYISYINRKANYLQKTNLDKASYLN